MGDDVLEDRDAIDIGHDEVEDNELVIRGPDELSRAGARAGAVDLEAVSRERARNEAEDARFVIDDQDPRRSHTVLRGLSDPCVVRRTCSFRFQTPASSAP